MTDKYGIVDWYFKQRGMDFDRWVADNTKEGIKNKSSEEFFDDVINYAKNSAETDKKGNILDSLSKGGKFRSEHIKQIKDDGSFNAGVDDYFNSLLRVDVNKADLPSDFKQDLISEIPSYDDRDAFDLEIDLRTAEAGIAEDITEEITSYESELAPYKRMDKEELKNLYKEGNRTERELAGVALKETAPRTLASLKGWERGLRTKKSQAAFQSLFT